MNFQGNLLSTFLIRNSYHKINCSLAINKKLIDRVLLELLLSLYGE